MPHMRMVLTLLAWAALVGLAPTQILAADEPPAATEEKQAGPKKKPIPDQATLDKQFQELLSGSQLVGTFTTINDDGSEKPPAVDRYTIESVKPLKNGFWQFVARIQYENRDVKMPLALEVKWAGDTPVITLTNVLVPGFGTFTARVLFYGNQYAGTWSAGDHGGHMYGKVEKLPAAEAGADASDKPAERAPAKP